MSFISKHRPIDAGSANVVELPARHKRSTQNAAVRRSQTPSLVSGHSSGAQLLSVRQHLTCKASIGIAELDYIEQLYSEQVVDKLLTRVRELLHQEFGPLRVYKRRQSFAASHHCMDSLVAGLLRVQYHSRQIPLRATRGPDGVEDVCGVPLCWGVGDTLYEAECRRQQQEKSRSRI